MWRRAPAEVHSGTREVAMLLFSLFLACSTGDDSGKDADTADTGAAAADSDGDGVADAADCAPDNADIYPGHYEIPYNGVDEDCDGTDVTDVDQDGHIGAGGGGPDCDDSNPDIHPDHVEICYDLLDNDCDGWEGGEDCDGDGFPIGRDCWDDESEEYPNEGGLTPEQVNPDAVEVWYDGTDADCLGDNDWDQDHDGQEATIHAGGDCDDLDVEVNTGMDEVWNEKDDDCDTVVDHISVSEATARASGDSGANEDGLGTSLVVLPDLNGDDRGELAVGAPTTLGYDAEGNEVPYGLVYILPSVTGIITPKAEKLSSIAGTGYTGLAMLLSEVTGEPSLAVGSATAYTVDFFPMAELTAASPVASATIDHDSAGAVLASPEAGTLLVGCALGNGPVAVSTWSALSGTGSLDEADWSVGADDTCADTVAIGDADGDGLGELAVGLANADGTTSLFRVDSAVRALGGATAPRDLENLGDYTYGLLFLPIPDTNGDGYDDVVVSNTTADGAAVADGRAWLMSAPDFGVDAAAGAYATLSGGTDGAGLRALTVADLDDDGALDLLAGAPGAGWVVGIGLATLGAGGDHVMAAGTPSFFDTDAGNLFGSAAWAADLDADARDDLIVTSAEAPGKVSVFIRD